MAVAEPDGAVHEPDPTGFAFTVNVYCLASAMLVDWVKLILATVDVGKVIRFAVVLAGVMVTWYSIELEPHSELGVAVNVFAVVASVITF